MKLTVLLIATALTMLLIGQAHGQSISVDHVDGLVGGSSIGTGSAVVFHLRLSNPSDISFDGLANGFRVYSPDGATWSATHLDTTGTLGMTQFDGGVFLPKFSANGQGADTVGIGALRFFSTGLPAGFDDVAFTITIGPISPVHSGKTICLDSSYYPPSGVWKWAASGGIDAFPAWDGLHCYSISGPQTGDSLFVSPQTLSFVAPEGGPNPPLQVLHLLSNADPMTYSVVLDSIPWLSVAPTGGSTPESLLVMADISFLSAGTYFSEMMIAAPQADNSPVIVAVELRVLPGGPAVTLDHVDDLVGYGEILTNEEITFHLRFTGDENQYTGLVNGFKVHSPTGAQWTTTTMDTTGTLGMADFDLGVFFSQFSVDGMGADTVGFGAVVMMADGMPPGFDDVVLTIEIGPVDSAFAGGLLCLDSTWFPPSGDWLWYAGNLHTTVIPAWDGPHCFTIINRSPSELVVTPDQLNFMAIDGEPDPPAQVLWVGSTGYVSDDFTVSADVPWISYAPSSSHTPDSVVVMAHADQMAIGQHTGYLTIESPTVQNSPVVVPVNLTIEPGLTHRPFDITIHAFTGTGLEDWTAHFGVNGDATDGFDPLLDQFKAPAPPGDYVRVFFPHPEWGQFSDEFATDIRYLLQQECKEWHMVVETNHATTVNLRCDFVTGASGYTISLFSELGTLLSEDFKSFGYEFVTSGGETHFTIRVCDYPIVYKRYLSGWSLVSSPLLLRDGSPEAVFGDDASFFQLYGWDDGYYAPDEVIGRGPGYWLLLPQATTVDYEGAPLQPYDSIVCVDLIGGWNLVGCPFDHPVDPFVAMIDSAGYQLPFWDAAAAGWISPVFYAWSGTFYFVTPELQPGYGYWFAALADGLQLCLTDVPPMATVAHDGSSQPPLSLATVNNQATLVSLSCGDAEITIGLAKDAVAGFDPKYDLPAPPESPTGVQETLVLLSDLDQGFGRYRQEVRGLEQEVNWTLAVVGTGGRAVDLGGLTELSSLGYQLEIIGHDNGYQQTVGADISLRLPDGSYRLVARQVGEQSELIPDHYYLAANYPNPFNPSTSIAFGLPSPTRVRLSIYNILGQEVASLVDDLLPAGRHELVWNGHDGQDRPVSSGVYFYRLQTDQFNQTRKMMLIK